MKQVLFFFFAFITLASCRYTTGSGNIITQKRNVGNFSGISVGGAFEVEVKIGPVAEVTVEADDNIMKYIETKVSGNILKIRTEDLHNYSDVHMKIYITTPGLTSIRASASAEVKVIDVLSGNDKLSFNASSSGSIEAEVDAPRIETDASSGATINLTGKTKSYHAEASSGADIKTWDLFCEDTEVSVSSGANAKVHASLILKASASSGGAVTYHGAANVTKSVSSGGSVEKRD
ncbi:MAG: head GIN domain-containing protein [Ferruginibacter sp.]